MIGRRSADYDAAIILAKARADAIHTISAAVAHTIRHGDQESLRRGLTAMRELELIPPPANLLDVMKVTRGIPTDQPKEGS